MTFENIVSTSGPAAGVVILMGLAVKWLLNERKDVLKLLDETRMELRELREARVKELRESASLLADSSQVVRDALASLEKEMSSLGAEMERLKQSSTASLGALEKAEERAENALRALEKAINGGS